MHCNTDIPKESLIIAVPDTSHRRLKLPTPEQVQWLLARSALNDASDEAVAWLDAPRPALGATDSYALNWFAAWMRILLRDLALFDVVVTHEGARQILGLPDVGLVTVILDRLHAENDDQDNPLTAEDFARLGKSN